jgi:hypothetical protein
MYMSLCFEQNAGQYHKVKTGNKSFGIVETLKCFGSIYQNGNVFKNVYILKYIEL